MASCGAAMNDRSFAILASAVVWKLPVEEASSGAQTWNSSSEAKVLRTQAVSAKDVDTGGERRCGRQLPRRMGQPCRTRQPLT